MCYEWSWNLTPEITTQILEIYGKNPKDEHYVWSEQDIFENIRKLFRDGNPQKNSLKIL